MIFFDLHFTPLDNGEALTIDVAGGNETGEDFVVTADNYSLDSNGNLSVRGNLDIDGHIAVNGNLIIDDFGHWVGDPTGLVGPQGSQGLTGPQGPGAPACADTIIPSDNNSDPFTGRCPDGTIIIGVECKIFSTSNPVKVNINALGNEATCEGSGARVLRITSCTQ